jgi:hypothetical protein
MQYHMTQAGAVKSLHFPWNSQISMKLHKYSEAQLREAVKIQPPGDRSSKSLALLHMVATMMF